MQFKPCLWGREPATPANSQDTWRGNARKRGEDGHPLLDQDEEAVPANHPTPTAGRGMTEAIGDLARISKPQHHQYKSKAQAVFHDSPSMIRMRWVLIPRYIYKFFKMPTILYLLEKDLSSTTARIYLSF